MAKRLLSPAEFWRGLSEAKEKDPKKYREILSLGNSCLLDGSFRFGSESPLGVKAVMDIDGKEFGVMFPGGKEFSTSVEPYKLFRVNFNLQDVSSETGLPIRNREKGEFGFEYFRDPRKSYRMVFDPFTRALCATYDPENPLDFPGVRPPMER